MKTKEEPDALKNEVEALNKKLAELTEDELNMIGKCYDALLFLVYKKVTRIFLRVRTV